ncbi:hypothetical protein ACFWMU_11865 [Streptomyces sp. NPDC058357]|uniref:hypothetical protein n=1 Tax=unclassified Streptomyces TaxID=2593676 RepID=UPI0036593BB8
MTDVGRVNEAGEDGGRPAPLDRRVFVVAGALVGMGAEFSHLAAIFGAVLLAATLLGPARRTVADRRLLAGAAIAVLLVLPDLWWQARHGWAMFEMTRALNGEHGGPDTPPGCAGTSGTSAGPPPSPTPRACTTSNGAGRSTPVPAPSGPGTRSGPNCGCTPDTGGRAARPSPDGLSFLSAGVAEA